MNYNVDATPVALGAICMILILLGIGLLVEKFAKTEYVDSEEDDCCDGFEDGCECKSCEEKKQG